MKLFNIIFCILFVISAVLQYNDPDPWLWMPIYLYAAVLCWLAFRERYYPRAYLFGTGIYVIYGFYKLFQKDGALDWLTKHHAENIAASMKAETPWIEDTREFFGLAILAGVLLINYWRTKREAKSRS